jgi:hypothetical protein
MTVFSASLRRRAPRAVLSLAAPYDKRLDA